MKHRKDTIKLIAILTSFIIIINLFLIKYTSISYQKAVTSSIAYTLTVIPFVIIGLIFAGLIIMLIKTLMK